MLGLCTEQAGRSGVLKLVNQRQTRINVQICQLPCHSGRTTVGHVLHHFQEKLKDFEMRKRDTWLFFFKGMLGAVLRPLALSIL